MSNFEAVIRPFQLPNTAPSRQYLAPKQQNTAPLRLYFGRSGSGRTLSASFSAQESRYLTMVIAEDTRGYNEYLAPGAGNFNGQFE